MRVKDALTAIAGLAVLLGLLIGTMAVGELLRRFYYG